MAKYIFLGSGGLALELYGYMKEDGHEILGYYALEESEDLKGLIPWFGDIEKCTENEIRRDGEYIVAVRLLKYRLEMIQYINDYGLIPGSFIHSQAYLSAAAKLGKGVVAFPRAMITGNVTTGDYLFIDGLSIISHGDVIGNNVVIGPAVTICGDCSIGDNVTFGVNSAVLPGTIIDSNCEVSINCFPPKVVKANSTIIGYPGKNIGIACNKNFKSKEKLSDMEKKIFDILKKIGVEVPDNDFNIGLLENELLDSLQIMQLFVEIEDMIGKSIDESEINPDNLESVATIIQMVKRLS